MVFRYAPFYLGSHRPRWLEQISNQAGHIPLFISFNTLAQYRRGGDHFPKGLTTWANSEQYLTVSAIAARLNVTPGTVRRWRGARWPVPFPAPDKETQHGTRTVALWLTCRWPLIQSWRHAQLAYLAERRHQPRNRRVGAEQDSGTPADRSTTAAPGTGATPPPPSHFLRVGRRSPRTGVRQGRIVRASVRRLVR